MNLNSFFFYFLLLKIGVEDGIQLNCTQVHLLPGEPFIAKWKDRILIESDERYYYFKENYNQASITIELQTQYEFKGQLLSSILVEKHDDIYLKEICNLHYDGIYFIQCISDLDLSNLNSSNNSNYSKTQFILPTQENELCNQIYKENNNVMVVSCFTQFHFNLHYIDRINHLHSNIQFLQLPFQNHCKRTMKQFSFDFYLNIIYQCKNWSIQAIQNRKESEFINYENSLENFNFHLQYELENFEICFPYLYIIDGTYYIKFKFELTQFHLEHQVDVEIGRITNILFGSQCIIKFIVSSVQNGQLQLYQQTSEQLKLVNVNLSTSNSLRMEYFNQYLFFLYQNYLEVHYNCFEKEKYQINSELIYFPPNNNYFYQFDQTQGVLTIYFFALKNWIQNPKKYFIFQIATYYFQCCDESQIQCFQIKVDNNSLTYSTATNNQIYLQIGCDNIGVNQLFKDDFQLRSPFRIENIFSNINSLTCHTTKNNVFLGDCTNLYYKKKDIKLIFYHNTKEYENIVYIQNNTIFFQICGLNQESFSVDISNKSVHHSRNSILIINQQLQQLEVYGLHLNSSFGYQKINLKDSIDYCIQKEDKILIFFQRNQINQPLPILMQISLLSNHFSKQFDQKLFFNQQATYFSQNQNLFFIQYQDFIVVKFNNNYYKIYLKNVQIVAVSMEVFHLKIIAIQDSTNQVLQYCLYFSNLKLMNIYSLHGYKIIQPLKYSVSQSYLGILTIKNNSKYLMLFLFLYIPDVQLKQVIKVSNDQWFYINDNIFYHDEQGDLSVINMHYFNISCQLNQNNYSEFFQYNSINLELKSEIDNSTIGLKQLQILILNQCQKLQPKQAKLFLLSHSNNTLSIHLAQYFYGAVDTLYLNGQCDAKLKGPFLVKYQIDECKSEIIDEEICLKYDKLQLEPDRNSQIINSLVFNFGFNQVKLRQDIIIIQINQSNVLIFPQNYFLIDNSIVIFKIVNFSLQILIIKPDLEQTTFDILDISILEKDLILIKIYCNLLQIENSYQRLYFYFQAGSLTKINIQQDQEINCIKNSDQFILIGALKDRGVVINFKLVSNISQVPRPYFNFYQQIKHILTLVQDYFPGITESDIVQYFNLKILNCWKNNSIINSQILINIKDQWVILNTQIDIQNNVYSTKVTHLLRNYYFIQSPIPYYFDEKILIILDQQYGKLYMYDLRQEQEFYDPIGQMNMYSDMAIQSYNSTHYIVYNEQKKQAFLIEIGYEISVIEKEKSKNCQLIAENEISKAEIQLIIQQDEINTKINNKSIIILSISVCILIVLIIFIFRRQQLKNNLRLFQPISLDQSKLQ